MGGPSIQVLGPTIVGHEDTEQPLRGQLGTFACILAASYPAAASRAVLTEAIWSDDIPKSASTALRVLAHRLRVLLGPDAIVNEHDGYRLQVSPGSIDAIRFADAVELGRTQLKQDRHGLAVTTLEAGLAEWRGPAYAGLDIGWLEPVAAGHDQLRCDAEELLLDALLRAGRADEAAARGSILTQREPYRERRWELLMLALYRSGRQREALEAASAITRLLRTDLGIEPGPRLRHLEADILDQRDELILASSDNLDGPTGHSDGIVGRSDELTKLVALLERDRLVTIVGPGGIGKTAVANALAKRVGQRTGPAIHWCDLSNATTTDLVPRLAAAMDIRSGAANVHDLGVALTARGRTVVFIDNADHHTDALRVALDELLTVSAVRFVCTSRVRLRADSETLFELEPLDPAGAAIELFNEISARVRPSRSSPAAPEPDHLYQVAAICTQLDGVPLAIELAAARTRVMSLAEISDDIGRVLNKPSPTRAAADRHATMTSAIEWSTGMLSNAAQRGLGGLAVFAGSFDMAAAEAIMSPHDIEALSVIEELVDHSLVQVLPGTLRTRYRLLAPIRHHAHERTAIDPARVVADRDQHLGHYLDRTASAFARFTTTSDQDITTLIDHDLDNLAEAHAWALQSERWEDDVRLYRPLLVCQLFDLVVPFRWASETIAAIDRTASPTDDRLVPLLFAAWYDALAIRLDISAATKLLARLDAQRATSDDKDLCDLASALHTLLVLHDHDRARGRLNTISTGDPYVTYARRSVGASIPVHLARRTGQPASINHALTAVAELRDAADWATAIGARSLATGLQEHIAQHLAGVGSPDEALQIAAEAEANARDLGMTFVESQASYQQVRIAVLQGFHDDATATRMAEVLESGVRSFSGARLRWQLGAAAELLAQRGHESVATRCLVYAGFADVPLRHAADLGDSTDAPETGASTIFQVAAEAAERLRLSAL